MDFWPNPITATFGDEFAPATAPLQLLAPAIAMLGIVSLCNTDHVQCDLKIVMYVTAVVTVLNIALNLLLIPTYAQASGAAGAMLISEAVFSAAVLVIAARTVGTIDWVRTLAGPLIAAGIMAAAILPLASQPLGGSRSRRRSLSLTLLLIERFTSPADLAFAARLARRFVPGRAAP